MKKLLVILGPTATYKTDLALSFAKKFEGEVIACDSRQVYKGLDIGTGKLPRSYKKLVKNEGYWEIDGVKVWMYDRVDPKIQYTAFQFQKDAIKIITDISTREKLPIIVGGTGLYLRGLLSGFDIQVPINLKLRAQLENLSLERLQERIASLSPTTWENLNQSDRNNPRRLIRKIEQVSMNPYILNDGNSPGLGQDFEVLKIGLTSPRPSLYSRINQRVFDWLKFGIIDETKKLIEDGVPISRFKEFGLEYAAIADFLSGKISSQEQLVKITQTKVRQYAKRQLTWFKKEPDVIWFERNDANWDKISHRLESVVENWYNGKSYGIKEN